MGESKARRFQPVLITKHSVCDGRQRRGFVPPRAKPIFIPQQPLRLPLRELVPRCSQREQSHRGIAAAAGLAMGSQPHEDKPAALPEAPQLRGIAEADGQIVIACGIGGDTGDHLLPETFALTGRMDSDPTDPQTGQRRRQGTAAMRRQRLGDQIPARPAKPCPHRPAKFGRKSPLGHQP